MGAVAAAVVLSPPGAPAVVSRKTSASRRRSKAAWQCQGAWGVEEVASAERRYRPSGRCRGAGCSSVCRDARLELLQPLGPEAFDLTRHLLHRRAGRCALGAGTRWASGSSGDGTPTGSLLIAGSAYHGDFGLPGPGARFDCPWSVVGVADVDEELVDKAQLTSVAGRWAVAESVSGIGGRK